MGGKAANYAFLRATTPSATPPGVAITFDLWDAFLDQALPTGGTLRAAIAARLSAHSWPPNMLALDADLDAIRDLIRDVAVVTPAQRQALATALAGFEPTRRLRFRSSTNVEDGDTFVGAGLYDSETGCLADDLDGDDLGPSACNPNQDEERGMVRAIQRVFASFYRRNAVLERLRRGVDEAEVGMAMLVTYSYPDDDELANGVATVVRHVDGFAYDDHTLVTQLGAVSVANPEGGALPEVVTASVSNFGTYLTQTQSSSLLPLGAQVMTWEGDYRDLLGLFGTIADAWAPGAFTIDLEYKKLTGDALVIKQVRSVPQPDTTVDVVPLLVRSPTRYCVFQGEASDVFALHRSKSEWRLTAKDVWLDGAGQASSLYADVDATVVVGATTAQADGAPASFPGFAHEVDGTGTIDRLRIGAAPGRFALDTNVVPFVARNARPVLTLDDLELNLEVAWDQPVWFLDWDGPAQRTEEFVRMVPWCPDPTVDTTGLPYVERSLTEGAVTVDTAYWWPTEPGGIAAGYTAPLVKWGGTTITGLTTAPIELAGYWSQTYRPHHHNFGADYIFEPRLEPGLAAATLAELASADVRALHVIEDFGTTTMWIIGLDGALRPLTP
ncbi:MAG: PEP/pyruvate-binding domain-containing protein [Kofleriaceae bacterium]